MAEAKTYGDSIKHWPKDMRPREKLLKSGEHTLTDGELLAVLLRTGYAGKSAVDLGRRIMQEFGSFRRMRHIDLRRWKKIKGIGDAKVAQIRAAFEIGRRCMSDTGNEKTAVRSPEDIAKMFMPRLRDLKVELFKVVLLDGRNNIVAVKDVSSGIPSQTVPHVRTIMAMAMQDFAAGIVCVHNHPSGSTTPSRDDRRFTQELRKACEVMDVKLVDHIIIGDNSFYSFTEGGGL